MTDQDHFSDTPSSLPPMSTGALAGAHLQLWPLSADDRQLYCELYGDPRVMRYVTAPLSSFAANRSFDTALARVHGATPLQWLWRASDR